VQSLWPVVVLGAALGACLTWSSPARADDAACFAASEAEVGLRKQQKLRAALGQLVVCGAPACPAEVRTECARRIIDLNAALPTLVLGAADAAGNDLAQVTVTVDGAPFATTLDGRALRIDPGSHTLHFEAPGKAPVDKTIVAREGEKDRHVNVVLAAGVSRGAGAGVVVPVAAGAVPVGPAAEPPSKGSSWSTQKTLAVTAAAAGVVGIGVGAVFGIVATSDGSTQKSDCSASSCTDHAGAVSAHNSSLSAGNVSTATFIAGGVLLAGGIVLWVTAPKGGGESPTPVALQRWRFDPMVSARGGGVMMSGSFQ
jgi:hypothetical protein